MKTYFKSIEKVTGLTLLVIVMTIVLTSCIAQPDTTENGISTVPGMQTVSWHEFGQTISISYPTGLAALAGAATIPAVPVDSASIGSSPAYVQIRFLGFPADAGYQLPVLDVQNNVPQVMVFQTADFPTYRNDSPLGYVGQLQSLTQILKNGVEPDRCAKAFSGDYPELPFLPWVNQQQTFCAQPQILEFPGGKGIRYLSYYSQGPIPVLDGRIFYTFQGLTDDGKFYISALFPVHTGIFPEEALPCAACADPNYNPIPEWTTLLGTQITQLNAQPGASFTPSLGAMDEVIKSIRIEP